MGRKATTDRRIVSSADSVKLYQATSDYVGWLARQTGQSRAAIIRELADEAVRERNLSKVENEQEGARNRSSAALNEAAIVTALRQLVYENAMLLVCMRDYVFRVYTHILSEQKLRWTQEQVAEGFAKRLAAAKVEAEQLLRDLFGPPVD